MARGRAPDRRSATATTAPIRRSYLPADYRRDSRRFDVVKTVYVEAEWNSNDPIGETRWVHEMAAAARLAERHGGAGLVRPRRCSRRAGTAGGVSARQERAAQAEIGRAASGRQARPARLDGLSQLAKRLCTACRARAALRPADTLVALRGRSRAGPRFPGTIIIVNHTGLPADRSAEGLAGWRGAMELLAREPNVMLKISGIGVPGHRWTPELQGPVVRDAIGIFGAERAMFASNFPVEFAGCHVR